MLFIVACFFSSAAFAQEEQQTASAVIRKGIPPVCYLGVSSGLNNPAGFVGFDINIKLNRYLTLDGGAGTSTWGNKLYSDVKYYLKENQRGFAFAGGFTFNSGLENIKVNMKTVQGTERVTLSLKPQPNLFIAFYHYWTVGHKYNRFFVAGGASVRMHPTHFHEIYGDPLTDNASNNLRRIAPGGLVACAGFSFALHRM